ncbi:MAG: hypothetical protein A2355_07940 [Spirochaetes bacterium RIFOXYB1_FULL_32_8]|nr:MAG: hypothetical protein A2355_07940 [Spirochaetes bacterium RIFOXYB1_FULL_32_8]
MGIFDNFPKYKQELSCKKCGFTHNADDFYCPKCGNKLRLLDKDLVKNKFTVKDIRSVYNNLYNSGDKLLSSNCTVIINKHIDNEYGSLPLNSTPVIISSIRSGYALRKTEEIVFPEISKKRRLDNLEIKKNQDDLDKIIQLCNHLLVDQNFIEYSNKEFIYEHLESLISDNVKYMIPILEKVYTGREFMSIGGFPHFYNDEIIFNDTLRNAWTDLIAQDTVYGYCLRMSEILK